jgi:hypothetical protein
MKRADRTRPETKWIGHAASAASRASDVLSPVLCGQRITAKNINLRAKYEQGSGKNRLAIDLDSESIGLIRLGASVWPCTSPDQFLLLPSFNFFPSDRRIIITRHYHRPLTFLVAKHLTAWPKKKGETLIESLPTSSWAVRMGAS